jgi:regulator of sigma E protease
MFVVERHSLLESIAITSDRMVFLTKMQFKALYMIITRKISVKDSIGGPIMIMQVATESASKGLQEFMLFFAFVNLGLGLINLFPIPMLDGGYVVIFLIEAIRRKPMSLKLQLLLHQIGMVIIVFLMLFVTYNDIVKFLSRLWVK